MGRCLGVVFHQAKVLFLKVAKVGEKENRAVGRELKITDSARLIPPVIPGGIKRDLPKRSNLKKVI